MCIVCHKLVNLCMLQFSTLVFNSLKMWVRIAPAPVVAPCPLKRKNCLKEEGYDKSCFRGHEGNWSNSHMKDQKVSRP